MVATTVAFFSSKVRLITRAPFSKKQKRESARPEDRAEERTLTCIPPPVAHTQPRPRGPSPGPAVRFTSGVTQDACQIDVAGGLIQIQQAFKGVQVFPRQLRGLVRLALDNQVGQATVIITKKAGG